jgi:hypothetical protein
MNQTVNSTEEFVLKLCQQSFLSLWSYANPRSNKAGKELCDILVVCEPDIIIFSVKASELTEHDDLSTTSTRWRKRAIEASVRQIYGAERSIKTAREVIRKDGTAGLSFPEVSVRRVHRVAVALGSKGKVPILFGDFGKGFVHVFDDTSLVLIMNELDTVSDFVSYLMDKEALYKSGIRTELPGGAEEDLLALYLHRGRQFPTEFDLLVVTDGIWKEFTNKDEYKAKKRADLDSYVWDRLIDTIGKDVLQGNLEFGSSLNESEKALRLMACESRFARRILGKTFKEFIDLSSQKKVRSRMAVSPSDIVYVFLAIPHGQDRRFRVAELGNRCFIARGLHQKYPTVIGIATERYAPGQGFSFDIVYLHKPEWTEKDQEHMKNMQSELDYFVQPVQTSFHEDEYPG